MGLGLLFTTRIHGGEHKISQDTAGRHHINPSKNVCIFIKFEQRKMQRMIQQIPMYQFSELTDWPYLQALFSILKQSLSHFCSRELTPINSIHQSTELTSNKILANVLYSNFPLFPILKN